MSGEPCASLTALVCAFVIAPCAAAQIWIDSCLVAVLSVHAASRSNGSSLASFMESELARERRAESLAKVVITMIVIQTVH